MKYQFEVIMDVDVEQGYQLEVDQQEGKFAVTETVLQEEVVK
jgi:hypothetical protein